MSTIEKRRSDAGVPRLTERDLYALKWVAEQYAVQEDLLQVLLGRLGGHGGPLNIKTTRKVIDRWRKLELAERRIIVYGQPSWVWLPKKGLTQLGLDYRSWTPKLNGLTHTRAVAAVRLQVEEHFPELTWVCERELRHQLSQTQKGEVRPHLPDAEVRSPGGVGAVEAELTVKSRDRLRRVLTELARRYDRVRYYATEPVRRILEEPPKGQVGSPVLHEIEDAARQKITVWPVPDNAEVPFL